MNQPTRPEPGPSQPNQPAPPNQPAQWSPPPGPSGAPAPEQHAFGQQPQFSQPPYVQQNPYGQQTPFGQQAQQPPYGQQAAQYQQAPQHQQQAPQYQQAPYGQYQRPETAAPAGMDPLGRQRPASVSIDQFTEPKSKAPWWVAGGVGVVVVGLLVAAFTSGREPVPAPATPSVSATSPAATGPTAASSNAVPFHSERDNADGHWAITAQEWTSTGLVLTMELTITSGTMEYSFFALDNATTQDYDPAEGSSESLSQGTASEGETVTGRVVFDKPKGDTTIYLAGSGRQVTALVVKG